MGRKEEKKGELLERGIIRPLNVLPEANLKALVLFSIMVLP